MKHFDDILHKAAEWRKENNEVALATVVSTWGSSPRPVGSQMVVSENLDIYGSVSGGCIESSVITAAQEIMRTCLLYTSPSPRDATLSRMPSSA